MTPEKKRIKRNGRERGNALFLILIAVALFAALSYAITQSGRGGGNIGTQTALITAGQVTEAPADTRSAVARMILSGQTAANIRFSNTAFSYEVFDQTGVGGGATNVPPPTAACVLASDCVTGWTYVNANATNSGTFVVGLGSLGVAGSDAFAVLQGTSGVVKTVCSAINSGLGMNAIAVTTPPLQLTTAVTWASAAAYGLGTASTVGDAGGTYLSGQDFACFNNIGGLYAYYAVMIDQ